jgi:glyoxylase-like metal-dependent hydrolase (beta-lactamase superfamily II)
MPAERFRPAVREEFLAAFLCVACGTQYPPSVHPPDRCPICEDERQYVPPEGQRWTTLAEMRGHYHNRFTELEPGVTEIETEPAFAIGQRAFLIQTPQGNALWETLAYLDETTLAEIERRGGAAAIAISHPHYYTTMTAWSRALGNVPIYLHEANRRWVMYPSLAIRFFEQDALELVPGVTVIRCGGHFPGASVLHWAGGAEGHGVLFSGDTLQVVADRRHVSFLYSYPNLIPLDPETVRAVVASLEPYAFERIYGAFGRHILADAEEAVRRSAERYIAHVTRPETNAE